MTTHYHLIVETGSRESLRETQRVALERMPGSRPLALERFLGQSLAGQSLRTRQGQSLAESLQTRQGLSPNGDCPGSVSGLGVAERIPRDACARLRVRPELVEPAVRADAESRDGLIAVVAPNSFGIEREPLAHPRR